jgi:SAM-dependent methyltransferase
MKTMLKRMAKSIIPAGFAPRISRWRQYGARVILDVNPGVWTSQPRTEVSYRYDYQKEQLSREYILNHPGTDLQFLDVGGGDGELKYLLGQTGHTFTDAGLYEESARRFHAKYRYYSVDLEPRGDNVLDGDVCDPAFLDRHAHFLDKFDVVYSNNVFEHLPAPWIAAANLYRLIRPGGICITLVPFSVRYHESPGDYFRYTHSCIPHLFRLGGPVEVVESGYDITARRNDEQGLGTYNDTCPVDRFGAWRETWTTVSIIRRRIAAKSDS